jgi:AraC-like DNA-binding protein/quercetin dioxygenase-like cupin family protein
MSKPGRYIQNLDMKEVDTVAYDYLGSHPHLYPVPEFISISEVKTKKTWSWPEHTHPNNEWIIVKKGRIKYWIDGQEFIANPGDFYFVQPGQVHKDLSISEPLNFFTITFQLIDAHGQHVYFLPPPFTPALQKIEGMDLELWPLFKKMFHEIQNQEPWCEEMVESTIWQLTWMVRRRLNSNKVMTPDPRRTSENQAEIVRKVEKYIKSNLYKGFMLSELADEVGVSRFYLDHVFTKAIGVPPLQYSLQLRMEQAKKLLADGTLAVYQVATKMGFDDPYYFSRQFKKITGVSPKVFQSRFKK